MASRELSILVTAKNMASKVLGQVKGDVNGLSTTASRASSNVGRNVGVATAAVAAGIALQVRAGVDSLVELERVENLTAAALASTGNLANQSVAGIRARAEAMEGMTGVDDKAIQNAQNLLLTFPQISEKAFEPTLESALNLNAALGGDDDSLQGVLLQVAKAVNDPIRGMTALRRSGVSFTKEQQDQVKALVAANDMMGAQRIVLGELENQFGGAAEAANQGATRAQRRWSDAVEDIQKSLATGFMPLIERVSEKMTQLIADPAFLPAVEKFGETLASGFDEAIDFAESVDWGAVGSALTTAGTGARMVMDAFLGAPPWLQTAIITGWGLNKLTGGVAGSLIGELGKGLIKGVLGMNAGVVNINAATVNGPGGGLPGGKGPGGFPLGGALALAGGAVAAGVAVKTAADFDAGRDQMAANLTDQVTDVRILSADDITARIAQVEREINKERPLLEGVLFNTNVKPALERGLTSLRLQQAAAATSITRGTEGQTNVMRGQAARAESSDRAMLGYAITSAQRLSAIQGIEGGNAARLTTIANKKTSVTIKPAITAVVNVQLQSWERRRISAVSASSTSTLSGGI